MGDFSPPQQRSFEAVAPYYDELMQGVPYRFWVSYLEKVWKHYAVSPSTVLDIACGTGTVALLLAQKGYKVMGADLSGAMLAEARKKAAAHGSGVEFFEQDAARLDLGDRRFDTIVSLFDSLNNILDPGDLQEAFVRAERHLAPGGLFIFDINTEYAFTAGLFNQRSAPLEGPLQYIWKARYDQEKRLCTITMDFSVLRDGQPPLTFQEIHVQRAYDHADIVAMLTNAGFANVDTYDAYTLSQPRRRSDRVFYVARRG